MINCLCGHSIAHCCLGKQFMNSLCILFQVQRTLQEADSAVGAEPVKLVWDHWKLDDCSEPLGVPGGCVCGRWYRQTAAAGKIR